MQPSISVPQNNGINKESYTTVILTVLCLLIIVFSFGCGQSPHSEDCFDFDIERLDSHALPFRISIIKDIITFQGTKFEEWSISIRNKDDERGCYINHVSSGDGIRKLIYLNPDTVRLIIDGPDGIYYKKTGGLSQDFSDAVKNDGIDIKILARQFHEDSNGIVKETIMPDIHDASTWRQTPIDSSEKRIIQDATLSNYMYLIAYDEKKDYIWIYDSNDSIIYRSPALLKFYDEEPYLARRYEQKVW